MYQVCIADDGVLRNFLSINDTDFVDVFFTENRVRLVTNSTELYAQLDLDARRSTDEESFKCRVYKKTLASLSSGDVFQVSMVEGRVAIEVYNEYGSFEYSCSFDLQVVADTLYQEKMNVVENGKGLEFSLKELMTINKIAKLSSSGTVSVDNKVACVQLRSGARVYRDVDTRLSLALTTKAIDSLRKCNDTAYSVRDWVLVKNNSFAILANKTRLESNEEFNFIAQQGAKFVARVDLGSLFRFMGRLKVQTESIVISIIKECCCVNDAWYEYKVPIRFEGAQLAPKAECKEFALPLSLLTGVLSPIGSNKFDLRITKNFNQMSCDKYTVVW